MMRLRAHDRRHDLAHGGRGSLDPGGKVVRVSGPLHQGMVKEPVVTVLATELPEIIPKKRSR